MVAWGQRRGERLQMAGRPARRATRSAGDREAPRKAPRTPSGATGQRGDFCSGVGTGLLLEAARARRGGAGRRSFFTRGAELAELQVGGAWLIVEERGSRAEQQRLGETPAEAQGKRSRLARVSGGNLSSLGKGAQRRA